MAMTCCRHPSRQSAGKWGWKRLQANSPQHLNRPRKRYEASQRRLGQLQSLFHVAQFMRNINIPGLFKFVLSIFLTSRCVLNVRGFDSAGLPNAFLTKILARPKLYHNNASCSQIPHRLAALPDPSLGRFAVGLFGCTSLTANLGCHGADPKGRKGKGGPKDVERCSSQNTSSHSAHERKSDPWQLQHAGTIDATNTQAGTRAT